MKVKFQNFLERFPEVELPVTLSDETLLAFSKENLPLQPLMIQQHINLFEDLELDEFTEYIPCFKIPKTDFFHAVVYWRGSLLDYQFILITYDKNGDFIDSKTLAGTFSDGNVITKSVATIDEDWMIYVVSGQQANTANAYNAASSKTTELELLPDGIIVVGE